MKKTGGPAYPVKVTNTTSQPVALQGEVIPGHTEIYFTGMTLRDYYAGQHLLGIGDRGLRMTSQEIAEECFVQADAMLMERIK